MGGRGERGDGRGQDEQQQLLGQIGSQPECFQSVIRLMLKKDPAERPSMKDMCVLLSPSRSTPVSNRVPALPDRLTMDGTTTPRA